MSSVYISSLKERIRQFGFGKFTINMAGGVIPFLWIRFIVGSTTLPVKIFALVFWSVNLLIFLFFCTILLARFIIYPSSWNELISHPSESLFTAAFSMALSTIVSGAIQVLHNSWGWGGSHYVHVIWGFWWLVVVVAFAVAFWITHLMITRFDYSTQQSPIMWMFPVATLTVASTCSDVLAASLLPYSPHNAWLTTIFSLVMLVVGISMGMEYVTLHLEHSITKGLPDDSQVIASIFPLAILCQCSYSFLLLAHLFQEQLPLPWTNSQFLSSESAGPALYAICFSVGFVLWALSTGWFVFAALAIGHVVFKGKLEFGPLYWALIFPSGVYANLCIYLGSIADASVFRIWGAIYAWFTFVLWLYIAVRSFINQLRDELNYFRQPTVDMEKAESIDS